MNTTPPNSAPGAPANPASQTPTAAPAPGAQPQAQTNPPVLVTAPPLAATAAPLAQSANPPAGGPPTSPPGMTPPPNPGQPRPQRAQRQTSAAATPVWVWIALGAAVLLVLLLASGVVSFGTKDGGKADKVVAAKDAKPDETKVTPTPAPTVTPVPAPAPSPFQAQVSSWDEVLQKSAVNHGGIFVPGLGGSAADQDTLMSTPTKLIAVASHGDNIKLYRDGGEGTLLPATGWVVVFYKPTLQQYASVRAGHEDKKCPFGEPPNGKFGVFQCPSFPTPAERRALGMVAHAEGFFVPGVLPTADQLRAMFPNVHDVEVSQPVGSSAQVAPRQPGPAMVAGGHESPRELTCLSCGFKFVGLERDPKTTCPRCGKGPQHRR